MSNHRTKYFLGPHVQLTKVHFQWVILDLARDQYLSVAAQYFDPLAPWIDGWHHLPAPDQIPKDAERLGSQLADRGILAKTPTLQRSAKTPALTPTRSLLDIDATAGPSVSHYLHLATFIAACVRADYGLRHAPLHMMIERIARRKAAAARKRGAKLDLDTIQAISARFMSLRLIYPRPYLCLFDCVALIELMARSEQFPDLVFGVTTDPFEAHCWVQYEDLVVNDTLDRITRFNPIMSV